ncbi:hypothetical protein BaRGS_00029027 [Batillaria attramentaria]|uniref:Uncharacterized protein n=1 Tax=Batillaria attramentaria TaxID=370345 RepID=A0ABD0JXI4_9CAEN
MWDPSHVRLLKYAKRRELNAAGIAAPPVSVDNIRCFDIKLNGKVNALSREMLGRNFLPSFQLPVDYTRETVRKPRGLTGRSRKGMFLAYRTHQESPEPLNAA